MNVYIVGLILLVVSSGAILTGIYQFTSVIKILGILELKDLRNLFLSLVLTGMCAAILIGCLACSYGIWRALHITVRVPHEDTIVHQTA